MLELKAVSLICQDTIAVFKEFNLKRHFQTKHCNFGKKLSKQTLQKKASDLLKKLRQQQAVFMKTSSLQENATKASFVLANKIAKQNKPFSEAEFIKDSMIDAVSVVCPEAKSKVVATSLARRTIVRRKDAIAVNLQEQLLRASDSFQWFSVAMDESTDLQDTAQLLFFIRGVDENLDITEELLSIESLKDTCTGKDLYNSVINSLIRSGLSLDKLARITTDRAPSLTGKHSDLVKLINDKIKEDFPLHSVLSFHCIIHQESFCKSSLNLKHVVDPVVCAVNAIRARELKHGQFLRLLEDMEADFTDVLYYTNVRCLSMRKVLKRVWDLKAEILMFVSMKDISCDFSKQMQNEEWICGFAFAVDIMQKLNQLNTKRQGKCVFAHELMPEMAWRMNGAFRHREVIKKYWAIRRLALVQMFVERSKELNHIKAKRLLRDAAEKGAKVVVLPEFFTCQCDPKLFCEVMEPVPNGPTFKLLSEAAKENGIFIFGGTYPEASGKPDMAFNTSNIFNPRGELIGQHRKVHMYDVDLGPHLHITESHHIIPGNKLTVVKTDYCKIGVGICFDLQFPEVARIYGQRGCNLLIYMGAINKKVGPFHWKALSQARAVDNQVYVASVGPATDETAPYVTWGHSSVVSPWGEIIASCESEEAIVYADIDLDYLKEVRRMLPIESQRRKDLYKTVDLTNGTPV